MAIDINSIIDKQDIKSVSTELLRRRCLLIKFAHDKAIPMDELHRECIISFLDKWETPKKPDDIPGLMKSFLLAAFHTHP